MTTTITGSGIDKVLAGAVTKDKLPAGTVLQVVSSTLTTLFQSTSSTFVSTGLAATITPISASSKVFIVVSAHAYLASGAQMVSTIYRNGTNLSTGGFTTLYSAAAATQGSANISYVDSPASTSAQTYTVYIGNSNGTQTMYYNTNGYSATTEIASITLMEIAA